MAVVTTRWRPLQADGRMQLACSSLVSLQPLLDFVTIVAQTSSSKQKCQSSFFLNVKMTSICDWDGVWGSGKGSFRLNRGYKCPSSWFPVWQVRPSASRTAGLHRLCSASVKPPPSDPQLTNSALFFCGVKR